FQHFHVRKRDARHPLRILRGQCRDDRATMHAECLKGLQVCLNPRPAAGIGTGYRPYDGSHTFATFRNGIPSPGELACASSCTGMKPDSHANRPASTAWAKAAAMRTASPALATAVFSNT